MKAVTRINTLTKLSAAVLVAAVAYGVYATSGPQSAKANDGEVTLTSDGRMKMTITSQRLQSVALPNTAHQVSGPAPLAKNAASI